MIVLVEEKDLHDIKDRLDRLEKLMGHLRCPKCKGTCGSHHPHSGSWDDCETCGGKGIIVP